MQIDCSNLLPISICSTCYKKLRYSVEFKELCISSFTFLADFLEKQNITLIKNENFDDDTYTFASCLVSHHTVTISIHFLYLFCLLSRAMIC